ncbi:MAG: threonine aldolase family protein [Flavobacteriales bacterium]
MAQSSQLQPPPSNLLVDLRSDTVTQPSSGMRQAMLDAPVGDDVFGEDDSIQALQQRCAELTGHEAALFCPSGTMTNQIAIQVHTRPGDEVICDKLSHIYNYEGGGIARNSGASVRLMHGDRGRYDVEEMIANINPADSHYARTSLVAVEDTCNKGGGAIWNVNELTRLSEASRARGLGFHLDGARVWNAWVQRGEWGDASALQNYGRLFDSMSLCLSKGLGCPVGSVLVGSESFIAEAHRSRKVMGGGMRQAGVLAAAGLYALDHHVSRLEQDHRHARMLEQTLGAHPDVAHVDAVDTNIVIFTLPEATADTVVQAFSDMGIACFAFGPNKVRLVTHLDVATANLEEACQRLAKWRA